MKLKLRTKLLSGFISVALIGSVIGFFGLINLQNLNKANNFLFSKATKPLGHIARVVEYMQRSRVNLYKIVLESSPEKIVQFESKIKEYIKIVDDNVEMYKGAYINEEDKKNWEDYIKTKENFYKHFNTVIDLVKNGNREEAIALLGGELSTASDVTNATLDKIVDLNIEGATTIANDNDKMAGVTTTIMISIIVIGLFISILLGVWLGVYIISRPLMKISDVLKSGSGQIALASNQLSSSAQEIANGATEQASSIEETTSSMEELASMVKQNVTNAQEASNQADKASTSSKDGYTQMEKMLESITEINKSSDQIKKIIKVIDDIAFQTNILALNAAVEAARAGEAGMGFAVVADEVKNLANRSAGAAKETSEMIEESIKRTEAGVQIAGKLAETFKEILATALKVSEMSREVETASKQQDTGINQVNKAIVQFDEVVQANASAAEETASSAEELLAQVENLNGIVKQLVILVSGNIIDNNSSNTYLKNSGSHEDRTAYSLKPDSQQHSVAGRNRGAIAATPGGLRKKEIAPGKYIPFEDDEDLKE